MIKCCLCGGNIQPQRNPKTGEVFWTQGHNALPLADGRCCDLCNSRLVIPARFKQILGSEKGASTTNK